MATRLGIVGVMGSGTEEHTELAEPLGRWLATLGVHLLTGGGGGVMGCVGRAFVAVPPAAGRRGLAIGILPGAVSASGAYGAPPGYPDQSVEVPIRTHLGRRGAEGGHPGSRNHINILTADVIVALPGGPGTASEARLALAYGKPTILYLGEGGSIAGLEAEALDRLPVARTLARVQELVVASLER